MWCATENLLHIATHICESKGKFNNLSLNRLLGLFVLTQLFQHLVALVQNKVFQMLQVQLLVAYQRQYTSGSANNNVGSTVLKSLLVLLNCQTAKEDCNLKK